MNTITISGRMTKDPEVKQTNSGKPVVDFTVAVDRPYKNAEGVRETDFLSVVAFGSLADLVYQRGYHNCQIIVNGRLQVRNYKDASGEDKYKHEIIAVAIEIYPSANKHKSSSIEKTKTRTEKTTTSKSLPYVSEELLEAMGAPF